MQRDGAPGAIAAIRRALSHKRDGHTFQLVGLGGPRKSMIQNRGMTGASVAGRKLAR